MAFFLFVLAVFNLTRDPSLDYRWGGSTVPMVIGVCRISKFEPLNGFQR